MDRDEAIKNLAKLSQRERQVLGLVCAGTPYKVIAKTLFIEISTVKAVMGRVYVKLGLDLLTPAERRKAIYQVYGPLLDSSALPNEPMPPEKEEPVSTAIIKMVDEDEIEVIPPAKSEVIYIPETKKVPDTRPPRPPRRSWGIIVGVLVIICICIVAVLLGSRYIPGLLQNQPNSAPQVIPPENTATPIPTSAQLLPTDTTVAQENTAVPTNPPQPTTAPAPTAVVPSISLPFSDSFDNGANSAWNILSGTWLTADGRYTISNTDAKWAFSVLDDPRWANYRVKVNVIRSHPGAFAEGEEAIIVRYLSSETKYLVFYLNTLEQAGWAFYDGKNFAFISGFKRDSVPNQYDLEIDAVGSTFTAKINGMTVQQISLSGYDNGGVGLGTLCALTPCSSFKDFQVSSAP